MPRMSVVAEPHGEAAKKSLLFAASVCAFSCAVRKYQGEGEIFSIGPGSLRAGHLQGMNHQSTGYRTK